MRDFTMSIEKLNGNNYGSWSTRMKFYLMGEDLWDIVNGSDTTPPTESRSTFLKSEATPSTLAQLESDARRSDPDELKKWKVKACKAMFALTVAVEDEFLQRIKDARTPKEAWDILAAIFAKKNDAKLQRLENELLVISQRNMSVSEYFSKVKSLCDEISKLDPENGITDTRMRRIIIHGLRPEYKSIVAATRGWATEPTLADLENLLINEEDLEKSMSSGAISREENALFTRRDRQRQGRDPAKEHGVGRVNNQEQEEWQSKDRDYQSGGARGRNESRFHQKDRLRDECFIYGKRGHFERKCWYKKVEGNVVTYSRNESPKEEEDWDLDASFSREEVDVEDWDPRTSFSIEEVDEDDWDPKISFSIGEVDWDQETSFLEEEVDVVDVQGKGLVQEFEEMEERDSRRDRPSQEPEILSKTKSPLRTDICEAPKVVQTNQLEKQQEGQSESQGELQKSTRVRSSNIDVVYVEVQEPSTFQEALKSQGDNNKRHKGKLVDCESSKEYDDTTSLLVKIRRMPRRKRRKKKRLRDQKSKTHEKRKRWATKAMKKPGEHQWRNKDLHSKRKSIKTDDRVATIPATKVSEFRRTHGMQHASRRLAMRGSVEYSIANQNRKCVENSRESWSILECSGRIRKVPEDYGIAWKVLEESGASWKTHECPRVV